MPYFNLVRVNQWVKNLLLFAPILLAHNLSPEKFIILVIIFFSFSFICSAVYIFNDLTDYKEDKIHPTKQNRPIASGKVSIKNAKLIGLILIIIGFVITILTKNYQVLFFYFYYIFSNIFYSLYLKRKFFLDIIFLVSFYIIRILIGAVVSQTSVSFWLILCSIFFFGSLAFLKRANEVLKYSNIGDFKRSYKKKNYNFLKYSFLVCAVLCNFVFCFYVNSSKSAEIYENFEILYFIPLILIVFFSLLFNQLNHKKLLDDPTLHIIKDKKIIFLLLLILIIYFLA